MSLPTSEVDKGRAERVLILVENESVPHDGRVNGEARTLAQAGYDVRVICPADPGEPLEEELDGFRVLRYPGAPARGGAMSQIREYAHALLHTQRLLRRARREGGFDIIHACNPPDLFFLSALPYKWRGAKFLFDLHDLAPELYESLYKKSDGFLMWALRLTERLSFRFSDAVVTVNDSYARLALSRGRVPAERVFVVRNGPREGWPLAVPVDPSLKRGRGNLVLYLGVMGYQDGLDMLLEVVRHVVVDLGFSDVMFALVGDGDALEDLRAMAARLGVEEHVDFVGWIQDEKRISAYLRTADACASPEPSSPLNDKSTFVKVMEYMASGAPIVAFDLPETRVSAGGSALYAPPGDIPAFAQALVTALTDSQLRDAMRTEAETRLPALMWERQEPQLLAAYRTALDGDGGARHR